jgi:hypothetical protein
MSVLLSKNRSRRTPPCRSRAMAEAANAAGRRMRRSKTRGTHTPWPTRRPVNAAKRQHRNASTSAHSTSELIPDADAIIAWPPRSTSSKKHDGF